MKLDKNLMSIKLSADEEMELIDNLMARLENGYIDLRSPIDITEIGIIYQILSRRRRSLWRRL